MERFNKDELILIRCVITGENEVYFKAKDYQGKKYLIKKNKEFSNFSIGDDRTFHAYKKENGLVLKRTILHPITHKQYIKINDNNGVAGKTLNELGVSLNTLHKY